MKVKKILIAGLSAAMLSTPVLTTISASASTWHKGVPSQIRGYWRSKAKYLKGRNDYERNEMNFNSNNAIYGYSIGSADPLGTKKLTYKYDGNNTYSIKGSAYGQGTIMNFIDYYTIHLYNHNKMKIYLNNSSLNKDPKNNTFRWNNILTRTSKQHISKELR